MDEWLKIAARLQWKSKNVFSVSASPYTGKPLSHHFMCPEVYVVVLQQSDLNMTYERNSELLYIKALSSALEAKYLLFVCLTVFRCLQVFN